VRQFAEKIEQDHQNLDQKLEQVAQQAGVQLEGKEFQKKHEDAMKDMKKLESKTGADFDKEFVSMMEKDHDKGLKEVKKAARAAAEKDQTELAALLQQAQSGFESHHGQARQLKETVAKTARAQGRRGETPTQRAPGSSMSGEQGTGSTGSGAAPSGSGAGSPGSAPSGSEPQPQEPQQPPRGSGQ
jgi:putative membrane protein